MSAETFTAFIINHLKSDKSSFFCCQFTYEDGVSGRLRQRDLGMQYYQHRKSFQLGWLS